MDHRIPLKLHTVLAFDGISCHVEEVIGQGSNAIVYKGWYWDGLNRDLRHHVLIKELYPFHPLGKIRRDEDGRIVVEPEAEELWETHKESFEAGNAVHLRLLSDHPDLMAMGANLNSYSYNGTLYSLLGYTGGRSLQEELNRNSQTLRRVTERMLGLLDALEAFHKSDYLHLDISPDNVLLVGSQEQERTILIDYNSARKVDSKDTSYLSCKAGYSAPEVTSGNLSAIGFASDLYSVAAVFYRCLMRRSLTLAESLRPKAPDVQESYLLQGVPQTVSGMASTIIKKGLHTLSRKRYQTIDQMRQAFRELLDRIDCVGVTHWSLWETGRRSVEELIRVNPSLGYLNDPARLYPIRLEAEGSVSLAKYTQDLLTPEGRSGIILAQGGMGKTTLLLHTAMLQSKRYSQTTPAVFYISLKGWSGTDTQYIRTQILLRQRFRKDENTFESAMLALHRLLEQPLCAKGGEVPTVLLLLDGLNEVQSDMGPLVQEINELQAMRGVRILAASRSSIPNLALAPAGLLPLDTEDIEAALGSVGVLIPRQQNMLQLLRTPLILSIYIQASQGARQLEVSSREELMHAYMAALLEKEIRLLPDNSPARWQIEAALQFVLPAIAAEVRKNDLPLTEQQLLAVVSKCWKSLDSRRLRKHFPAWIGHSKDIRADARNAEEWYGIIIHTLLWQRLGMLMRTSSGGYHIFHQLVEEYLAGKCIRLPGRRRLYAGIGACVLCLSLAGGLWLWRTEQQRQEAELQAQLLQQETDGKMQAAMELAAAKYAEYGDLYRQVRKMADYAMAGDAAGFDSYYSRCMRVLETEAALSESEATELRQLERWQGLDGQDVSWSSSPFAFEYELYEQLFQYSDSRAAVYADILPVLKSWMEQPALQKRVPGYAQAFSELLEADAGMVSEMYHRSAAIHLSGMDEKWVENVNALIALIPELDAHRDTAVREDRGQLLQSLQSAQLKQQSDFDAEHTKVKNHIRSMNG